VDFKVEDKIPQLENRSGHTKVRPTVNVGYSVSVCATFFCRLTDVCCNVICLADRRQHMVTCSFITTLAMSVYIDPCCRVVSFLCGSECAIIIA